jgi:DNA helicase-2/ATP-dependent DNA helicase PcrA
MQILNAQTLLLTPEQSAVVAHDHGPALVFAVAGAGKTTAMVHRIERLVREGVFAPKRILATSFGKATVEELKTRLAQWSHCSEVKPMTLHGIGWRVMKQMQKQGLLPEHFVLPDGEQSGKQIYYQALKVARQNKEDFNNLDKIVIDDFLDWVGMCKGNLCYADLEAQDLPEAALAKATQAEAPKGHADYLPLYQTFEKVRIQVGTLTFDDLLLGCWEAFMRHPELLESWQTQYDTLLVDEFQDINLAQSEILDLLAQRHHNYMAIGDDDQTIYQWRGASPSFILGFSERYKATRYLLTDNFRSQATHLALANAVIHQNEHRAAKRLHLTQGFHGISNLSLCNDGPSQALEVVKVIEERLNDGVATADIAVLVRTYAQTPYIERALIERNIPYHLPDGKQFFHRPEIRDLLSYVSLAIIDHQLEADPGQAFPEEAFAIWSQHWKRIRNRPTRFLSNQVAADIVKIMLKDSVSLCKALKLFSARCEEYMAKRLREFAGVLNWLTQAWRENRSGHEILTELDNRMGWSDWLVSSSTSREGQERADNVQAFLEFTRDMGSLQEVLEELRRLSQNQLETQRANRGSSVTLTSIHRAKGQEWDTVLIPGCNEGVYPPPREPEVEAERRLLYVALTRPKQNLHLFYTREAPLSPFLRAADADSLLMRVQRLGTLLELPEDEWKGEQFQQLFTLVPPLQFERYLQNHHAFPDALLRRIQGCLNWIRREDLWHKTRFDARLHAIWCSSDASRKVELDANEIAEFSQCFFPSEPDLLPGQVRHARFGLGTIVKEGVGKNQDMMLIRFAGKGKMQLPGDDPELTK